MSLGLEPRRMLVQWTADLIEDVLQFRGLGEYPLWLAAMFGGRASTTGSQCDDLRKATLVNRRVISVSNC